MYEAITTMVKIMMEEFHTLREHAERASNMEVSSQAASKREG